MKRLCKILLVLATFNSVAQEYTAPLKGNINLIYAKPAQPSPPKNYVERIKAVGDTLNLPLFEDFYYGSVSPYPSGSMWTDSSVYVNTGFAIAPMSIGVATFDGLNKKGYPYNISAQEVTSSPADTLTSKPIALGTIGPPDSLGLSFFYQRQGYGENPEINDSLILEFYKPLYPVTTGTVVTGQGQWFQAWGIRGTNSPSANDSTNKHVFVRITDTAYFHNGFRFRLKNKATGSGSVDHWHVDYIKLAINTKKTDTTFSDVTFGYVPKMPLLKNYTSMPWWQYNATETDTSFFNYIRNNNDSNSAYNVHYQYDFYDANNALLYSKDLGTSNVKPFYPHGWDKSSPHKNPGCTYTISPLSDSTHFLFKHYITKINNDFWNYNDTVTQQLVFNNYYSYDDGSAERGYYHNVNGAKDAVKYSINVTDTLRALDIYFDPVIDVDKIQISSFRMYVWQDNSGQPGLVLRKDSAIKPSFLKFGHNKIPRYFFTSPMILNPGTYYVGLQQIGYPPQPLNIGIDMNLDNHAKLYYDVSGAWQQSTVPGSLMIHPVFGHADRALVGINEPVKEQKENFITVYPNPANDKLFISAAGIEKKDGFKFELYSVIGNKLMDMPMDNSTTEINLDNYAAGIYFVALKQSNNTISYKKFIIAR